jgi:hypothetical protein
MLYAWIAAFLVPPVVILCDWTLVGRRLGLFRGALLSAATILVIVVGTALLYGRHLQAELAAFDRDGDGIFAEDEATPEQERALSRVTNDLSRKLAPITGGAFAVGYSALGFGGAAVAINMRQRWKSAG